MDLDAIEARDRSEGGPVKMMIIHGGEGAVTRAGIVSDTGRRKLTRDCAGAAGAHRLRAIKRPRHGPGRGERGRW
jgi:hypothetical protein